MANYDAQINILVAGQRSIQNLANQLNAIEDTIGQIERRWRNATGALQRANIRLGVTGAQQPRGEGGRFVRDPDRQARFAAYADQRRARVEQQMSRLALGRTRAEAVRARNQINDGRELVRQTERRITVESRLNAAIEQFERRRQTFARGGGGASLPQNLQRQIQSISAAYDAAGGSATRNIRLVRALSNELVKLIETQNEYNRSASLRSKGFEAGRRLQERISEATSRAELPRQRVTNARTLATEAIAASRRGDQQAYSEAVRRATAAVSRLERESKELARAMNEQEREISRIAKLAPRSPVAGGINFPGSPRAIEAQRKQQDAALKRAQQGFIASPVLGAPTMVGSPKWIAAQEKTRLAAERALRAQERAAKLAEQRANTEAERSLKQSQKGYPSSPVMGTSSMSGSPKWIAAQERGRVAAERRLVEQRRAEERAARIQRQVALAAERSAEKALKEAQRGYPSSPILGSASMKGSPRWIAAQESAKRKLEIAALAVNKAAQKALKEAQKGYPASPVLGAATIEGSPRWKAAQESAKRKLESAAKAAERAAEAALREAQKGFPASPIFGTPTIVGSPKWIAAQEKTRLAAEKAFKAQEKAAKAAEGAANKEAERILRESQKGYPASPIMGTASMTGSPKWIAAQERSRAAAERRIAAQRRAEERAAKIQIQAAAAAERAADKALKEAQKGYPSSPILGAVSIEGSPRWKATQESARQKLEKAAFAINKAAEKALKEAQKGYPSSPILGTPTMVGSPKWMAAQERLRGRAGGGAGATGLEAALKSLKEARAARVSFLGEGVSPAEAIDKIVREFGTKKDIGSDIGKNVTDTFVSQIKGGASKAASASKTFASAATEAIKKVFGIASPSRFIIELVKNLADTYVREMQKSYPRIKAATAKAFGEETLLRDVTKLRATNRGFEEYGRPSTGFKPFPLGAGTPGATSEFNDLMSSFRRQIAELTTQPEIYGNMLNALPNSRITTDLIGVANRRALASEIPSFMSTQRMLGPGELERFISGELAKYLKDIKIPNPWIGPIGDYKAFIAKVISETDKLRVTPSGIRSLPQGQIAGLLPEGVDISSRFEARLRQAHERSAERGARVLAEDAATRLERAYEAAAAVGGRFLPPSPPMPPGGGGGAGGAGDFNRRLAEAVQQGPQALLGLEELRQPARASINELNALSGVLTELRSVLDPTAKGFDKLDGQLREVLATVSRQLEVRAPEADFLTRRTGDPRLARGISEGVIGGAFPLLFGQGIGASIGGGLGGFAGGFAGGGLGFGLSLVGTALGTALDTFNNNLKELGKSLGEPTSALEAMKNAGLKVDKQLEFNVRTLEASGRAYQAQSVVLSEIEKQLGAGAVKQIQALNAEQKELETEWQRLSATLTSLLLPAITGTVAIINDAIDGFKLLSSIKLPGWLQSAINTGVNVASFVNPTVGLSRLQFQYAAGRGTEAAQQQTGRPQLSPEKTEESRKAALQAADEIKQAYREGFKLQQQAIDLERQAADFRKRIADDIFNKQQEVLRAQVETDRLSADLRIKAVDLEYQKRINQEEGLVAQLLEAEAELIRVKAAGQADIDSKRKLLELDIAKQERDTQNYIRDINAQVNNIRRQTLQYEMDVQDSREASERRIAELRRIDQMGAATGSMPTGPGGRQYYGPGGAPTGGRIPGGAMTNRRRDPDAEATGWDIVMPGGRGASVRAPLALTITGTGFQGRGAGSGGRGYGNWISGEFALGGKKYELLLGHFDQVNVARGMQVPAGAELGKQGITGRTFGSHVTTHVNPMRGASVNDAWNALEQITRIWEGGATSNPQIEQMQRAQSQIRPVNIPMVDVGGISSEATRLDRQGEQTRRTQLSLQEQLNALDVEAAREKLFALARGQQEIEQRRYQINLLTKQIQQTTGLKDDERERGMLAGEYIADTIRTAEARTRFLQLTKLDAAEQKKITEEFGLRLKARKEQYDLDVKILGIARMEAAARGGREAVAAFVEQNKQLDLEIQKRQLRLKLIAEGSSSQKIETEMRVFELQNKLTESLDKLNKETNDAIRAEAVRLGINADMITSTFKLTEATLESLLATEQDTKKKEEYRKELERILALRKALEGDATSGTQDAIDKARGATTEIPGEKIGEAYKAAKDRLDELINKENQAIFVAQTIGDAFGQAFREIAAGTATAQEILSGFFQSLANSFADMAAQIIAEMIKMYILKQLLNLFGGGSPFLGDASLGGTDWGAGGSGTDWSQAPGIIDLPGPATPFAMGGVVNSPTLFKFANGGAMNTGVMGEAGPEAILPLSRGSDGKLGVSASGSGGDVNVTVNVDAKGTSVQGNDQSGNQLGRAISAAVQQEIIKQRRPGGLLNK